MILPDWFNEATRHKLSFISRSAQDTGATGTTPDLHHYHRKNDYPKTTPNHRAKHKSRDRAVVARDPKRRREPANEGRGTEERSQAREARRSAATAGDTSTRKLVRLVVIMCSS